MTLPNTITMTETIYANGVPVPHVEVTVQLVASNIDPNQPGYMTADAYSVGDKIVTHTNALGAWSVELEPNDLIYPANTRWRISYRFPKAGFTKLPVYVLAAVTPSTQRVEDSLTDGPDGLQASVVTTLTRQRPLPGGARDIAVGDSVVAGAGSTLSNSSNNGDSRQAVGSWFSRLAGQNPDRYLKVRNAGIGGDIVGGLGVLTERAGAGATSLTYRLDYGNQAYNTSAGYIYIDGYSSTSDVSLPTGNSVDNGDGTWTVQLATATTVAHEVGEEVGWGVHGRLQVSVIDWAPDIAHVAVGTNDSALVYVTAAQVATAITEVAQRLRNAGIEPYIHDLLPRTTNTDNVVAINDQLRYLCRVGGTQGAYHLIPLWHHFASGSGGWADATMTADNIHPSDLGHQAYADIVHTYMSVVGLRIAMTPLAPMDSSTTNEIANACFLTGAAGGGGTVPTGWTLSQFFTTLTVPGIEAPAADDGIIGQWATLTCTTGAAGSTSLQQTLATFTVGDEVYFAARVKVTGVEAGFTATVQFLTGLFTIDLGYQITDNMDMTLCCTSATLSAVTQSIVNLNVAPSGHAGKLMVAQPIFQNLTELERAA